MIKHGYRPKRPSKRRWIARFHIGKPVPWLAIMEYPDLKKRLVPAQYMVNMDAIRRAA